MAEFNDYLSSVVETNAIFNKFIKNLLDYNTATWGWTEQDYISIIADFKVPENNLYHLPYGNYKMINIPSDTIPGVSLDEYGFVNVYVMQSGSGKYIIIDAGDKKYGALFTSLIPPETWDNLTVGNPDEPTVGSKFHIGASEPNNTDQLWIDTSKFASEKEVCLRWYNGTEWVSYSISEDRMDRATYDPTNKLQDPVEYYLKQLRVAVPQYCEFVDHKNNLLPLGHLTEDERILYESGLTVDELNSAFEPGGEAYILLMQFIKDTVQVVTKVPENTEKVDNIEENFEEHISPITHVTNEKINKWNSAAEADHTHIKDGNVRVDTSQIVKNAFDEGFPEEIVSPIGRERCIKMDSMSILANPITPEELSDKYHNGNMLYIEDESGKVVQWWKIIDNTKFGSTHYLDGLRLFASASETAEFYTIADRPSTISGYNITDDVVSMEEFNTLQDSADIVIKYSIVPSGFDAESVLGHKLYIGIQKSLNGGGGTAEYPMSTMLADLDIIALVDNSESTNGVVKFTSQSAGIDRTFEHLGYTLEGAEMIQGISMVPTSFRKDKYFDILYQNDDDNPKWKTDGLGRMLEVNTDLNYTIIDDMYQFGQVTYYVNIAWDTEIGLTITSRIDRCAISLQSSVDHLYENFENVDLIYETIRNNALENTIGLALKTLNNVLSANERWIGLSYGNFKYVAISDSTENDIEGSNTYMYSTDGEVWTNTSSGLNSRVWRGICFGNGKFVAVSYRSNNFAYSTDGINWTETSNDLTERDWYSVCYGANNFVAVSYNSSNSFAYSSDGIIWTETTIGVLAGNWGAIIYRDKFVVTGYDMDIFLYSTDGISWSSTSVLRSAYWVSMALIDSLYLVLADHSSSIGYSSDGINWTFIDDAIPEGRWLTAVNTDSNVIAFSYGSSVFAYTADGLEWQYSQILDGKPQLWRGAAYNKDRVVLVKSRSSESILGYLL